MFPYIIYTFKQKKTEISIPYENLKLTIIGFKHIRINDEPLLRSYVKAQIKEHGMLTIKPIRFTGNKKIYCGVYINGIRYGTLPLNTLNDSQYYLIKKNLFNKTFKVRLPLNDNIDKSKVSKQLLRQLTVEVDYVVDSLANAK